MVIRPYAPDDAEAVSELRWRSVRHIGPRAYSAEQIAAWLPEPDGVAKTRARCEDGRQVWLAVSDNGTIMGVTDLEPDGHVDTLYVDPDHAGRGVGSALLAHVDLAAKDTGMPRLYTEASELAAPVFERAGYSRDGRRDFDLRGVRIHNYAMSKRNGCPDDTRD